MTFSLKDIRFTARRSGDANLPALYPRLFRDRSIHPKVAIAIQYFDSMVGRERREFDSEVLVQFFGDHKTARCMVGCLARTYRFRAPAMAEMVRPAALRKLQRAGLDSPVALRLRLFDEVNDAGHGFLPSLDHDPTHARLERRYGLRQGDLDRVLRLDADEHAVLTRYGTPPDPEDVVAHYNFAVLETLLRHAERVELSMGGGPAAARRIAAEDVLRLCARGGVEARLEGGLRPILLLRGRQDALGFWARHGGRVARTVVQLVTRARGLFAEGGADIWLRSRRVRLRLTPELLDLLAGATRADARATTLPVAGDPLLDAGEIIGGADTPTPDDLVAALRSIRPRRSGRTAGGTRNEPGTIRWRLRRWVDPQAWAGGVLVADAQVSIDGRSVLLCGVDSAADARRLLPVARRAVNGEQLLFLGASASLGPLQAASAWTLPLPEPVTQDSLASALATALLDEDSERVA
jgi:hypothetical protein